MPQTTGIQGLQSGKTLAAPLAPTMEQTSMLSSKRSVRSQEPTFMYLSLKSTEESGQKPEPSWEMVSRLPGVSTTPSVGAFPSVERESSLSQILEVNVPEKYYLTARASLGILRRAWKRGKNLPEVLNNALVECIKIGGDCFGQKEIRDAGKILRELWEEVGEKTFKEWILRALISLQQEKILFNTVLQCYAIEGKAPVPTKDSKDEQTEGEKDCRAGNVCDVRGANTDRSAPYRSQSYEQYARKFDEIVFQVSSRPAQKRPTETFMCCLRGAAEGAPFMLKTLASMEKELKKRMGYRIHIDDKTMFDRCGAVSVWDARGNGDGETSPTITGDHNNRITDYTAVIVESKPSTHYFSMQRFDEFKESDAASTLKQRDYKDVTDIVVEEREPIQERKYIVRRLTPTESLSLNGLPKWWCDDVKGRSDTKVYRLSGNGIALPCAIDVLYKITKAYNMKGAA